MSKQYDYDIIVKKINLFKKPSDLEVRIECGKQVIIIPTTSNNDYQFPSTIQWKKCNTNEDIIFNLLNEYNGSITTNLVATMPFNQISTQSTHYDEWITVYHRDTKEIAGALLLCLICRLSPFETTMKQNNEDKEMCDDSQTSCYPKGYRAISSEVSSNLVCFTYHVL